MNQPDRSTGCLFCGNDHASFTTEEHVLAAALGNRRDSGLVEREFVIPPGEICDKCNNRRLSLRDKALADWPPISAFRTLAQIANRSGRLVDAVELTEWHLRYDHDDPRNFSLHLKADTGPSSGRDQVARGLCKVALETRWLTDPADARSRRWDTVAAAAIGRGPLPPGLVMGLILPNDPATIDLRPESSMLIHPDVTTLRICVRVQLVGLDLILLLDTRPPPSDETIWWTLDIAGGTLVGQDSISAAFRGRARELNYLGRGGEDPPSGQSSRLPSGDPRTSIFLQPSSDDGEAPV